MGLTADNTGINTLKNMLNVNTISSDKIIVALAGNPNTGKSTVFNSITGMKQHTGNWTGKTVTTAYGNYKFKDKDFILVDLPGTYSLLSNSYEEEIARDFICFTNPQAVVVVTDATCLERNLNLVLQISEITNNVIVCVNLIDEAKRKKIDINLNKLSSILGMPVVGTNGRSGEGLDVLMDTIYNMCLKKPKNNPIKIKYSKEVEYNITYLTNKIKEINHSPISSRWIALKLLDEDKSLIKSINKLLNMNVINTLTNNMDELEKPFFYNIIHNENLRDEIVLTMVRTSENIINDCVKFNNCRYNKLDRKIDTILTSKTFGIPVMIILLTVIFWITLEGANVPSDALASLFSYIEVKLCSFFKHHGMENLIGPLIFGVYRTLGWVISVMLPPMAIFFPLFTLLEDLGYLPRVAFNMDNFFKKACAHGKQALTMCMGFGCNAAGIVGCRIIDSPRERLIAILTNNFVPCNGRFPILISIATIFIAGDFSSPYKGIVATLSITSIILLGIFMTLLISKILSKTILKGVPSSFTLELPPYRKPQVGKIIIRSIFDRTLFVLARAVVVAAPAGLVIWGVANIDINGISILNHIASFLNPFAHAIGMDGYILLAFILGMPANEIVIPIMIMSYMSTSSMLEFDTLEALRNLLVSNGWTWVTAINVMLLCLMHFPCATTLLTIKKETKSAKWTFLSFIIPTITGITICFLFTQTVRLLELY